jgi:dTDP-glucose 4,6-dehydratase
VEDRPGHDRRYALDSGKTRSLGWSPRHDFRAALQETVAWYVENRSWWEKIKSGDFRQYYERLYGARLMMGGAAPPGKE